MKPTLPPLALRSAEAAQARIAQQLIAALTELQATSANPDIDSRLSFAHDQAMAAARQARAATASAPTLLGSAGATAVLGAGIGPDGSPWWLRLGSLLPLAVLLAGLMLIDSHYTRSQIDAAAEIDAALLADDLPPEAYRDQGFVEYLKTSRP
ncbi:MAG: DUF3619 family protein [Pseudomonadota bacterium]